MTIGGNNHRHAPDLRMAVGNIAVVGLGAASALEVHLIGRLFYTEVILLFLLPYLLVRVKPHPGTERFHKPILVFGAAWLWAQVITDLARMTPFEDWSRGLAKISFMLLNYIALRRLLNSDRLILAFATGLAIGLAISVRRLEFDADTTWKFGLGAMYASLLMVACGLGPLRRFWWLPILSLFGCAILSARYGARSMVGTVMLAAGILALGRVLAALGAQTPKGRAIGFLSVGVVGLATYSGLGYISDVGLLGQRVQKKHRDQVNRGRGSLLLGGRNESRVSIIAIGDSPLIGHGSWAKDIRYRRMYEVMDARDSGKPLVLTSNESIPGHSFFFGSWIEAGLLGAVWWGFVLYLVFNTIGRLLTWTFPLGPLAAFVACQALWDIPFSPFGANVRINMAFALVLLPIAASQASTGTRRKLADGREVLVAE